MQGKAKFIFPVLMAGVMAFLMTGLVTWLNLGFPADFLKRWMTAFIIAWPCAAPPIGVRLSSHSATGISAMTSANDASGARPSSLMFC